MICLSASKLGFWSTLPSPIVVTCHQVRVDYSVCNRTSDPNKRPLSVCWSRGSKAMYPHINHIPQPPHSAGLNYQGGCQYIYIFCLLHEFLGLRPRIDPAQVPSPIAVTEIDRQKWESKTFMTLPGTYAPLCTSDFMAVDQGSLISY